MSPLKTVFYWNITFVSNCLYPMNYDINLLNFFFFFLFLSQLRLLRDHKSSSSAIAQYDEYIQKNFKKKWVKLNDIITPLFGHKLES